MYKKPANKKSITLNVLSLPILMLIFAAAVVGSGLLTLKNKATAPIVGRNVLSEDSDREEGDGNNDSDSNDNDDEDSNNDNESDDSVDSNDRDSEDLNNEEDDNEDDRFRSESEQEDENEVEDENDDRDDSRESTEAENEDEDENDDNEFEVTFRPDTNVGNSTLSQFIKAKLKQEIESEDGLGTSVNKVELEVKTSQGKFEYEGSALKSEKLFGLFGIEVPVDIVIDPNTGQILQVNQSFWSKILDFFSF